MSKQGFELARALMKAKRYEQARDMLEEMSHPKAQDWIFQIDQILERQSSKQAMVWRVFLLVGIAIFAVAIMKLTGKI